MIEYANESSRDGMREYTLKRLRTLDDVRIPLISILIGIIVGLMISAMLCFGKIDNPEHIAILSASMCLLAIIIAVIIGAIISSIRARKRFDVFVKDSSAIEKYIVKDADSFVTDKEKRLIRTVYIEAKSATIALFAMILTGAIGGLGLLILDFTFYLLGDRQFNMDLYLIIWISILAFLSFAYGFCAISAHIHNLSDTWDKLLQIASPQAGYIEPNKYQRSMMVGQAAAGDLLIKAGNERSGTMLKTVAGINAGRLTTQLMELIAAQAESFAMTFNVKLPKLPNLPNRKRKLK